jgi:GntR family transcriptional repressor for pyruvate dehydrogenase complex
MKLPPERKSRTDRCQPDGVPGRPHSGSQGIVNHPAWVGTIVQQITQDHVGARLNLLLRTSGFRGQLHEVRSILEVEMAGLAAQQATGDDIANLRGILAEMDKTKGSPKEFADKDAEFHTTLAQTTHNPLFSVLLGSIRDLMQEVRLSVSHYPDLFATVMPDHYRILGQIIAKDVDGARQAMQAHLEHARSIQQAFLAQQESAKEAEVAESAGANQLA